MTTDGHWDADFIVIGSGFGGAVSALRLAEKGYSVLVLEQGKRYATEDFPRTSWSLRKYLWAPRLGLHGIQVLTFLRHALVLHGRGVGGGSLVYANTLIEPEASVFQHPDWGPGDWGTRLAPHYREARRMLGAVPCEGVGRMDQMLREIGVELRGEDTFRVHDVGVFFGEEGRTVPVGSAILVLAEDGESVEDAAGASVFTGPPATASLTTGTRAIAVALGAFDTTGLPDGAGIASRPIEIPKPWTNESKTVP